MIMAYGLLVMKQNASLILQSPLSHERTIRWAAHAILGCMMVSLRGLSQHSHSLTLNGKQPCQIYGEAEERPKL